jgi:cytoskeletal protein RodZ
MIVRTAFLSLFPLIFVTAMAAFGQEAVVPTERSVEAEETPADTSTSMRPSVQESTPAPESKPAKRSKSQKTSEPRAAGDIQDSMTADEFKSAGLDKLSSEELRNLNAWLQGYRQKAETKAAETAVTEAKKKSKAIFSGEAVLSRVNDDNFAGVNGHSIIKLEDGTVWKQANPDDRFHAQVTNHPPAKVSHSAFGYKMHIVGVPEFYVDPVR